MYLFLLVLLVGFSRYVDRETGGVLREWAVLYPHEATLN